MAEARIEIAAEVDTPVWVRTEAEAVARVLVAPRSSVDCNVDTNGRVDRNEVVDDRVDCTAAGARILVEAGLVGVGQECRRL